MITKEDLQSLAARSHREISQDVITMLFHLAKRNTILTPAALSQWVRSDLIPEIQAMAEVIDACDYSQENDSFDDINHQLSQDDSCACSGEPRIWDSGKKILAWPIPLSRAQSLFHGPLPPNEGYVKAKGYIHANLAMRISMDKVQTSAVAVFPYNTIVERDQAFQKAVAMDLFSTLEFHDHPPKIAPLLLRFSELSMAIAES